MRKQAVTNIKDLKVDASLEEYADKILFPEKVEKATQFVKNLKHAKSK